MPRTQEQNKVIREEKIQTIKDAALDLFAQTGYHNTSVRQIANKTGMSKGLLYNYFKSKDDLLKSIIVDFVDENLKYFDPNNDGILTDDEFYLFLSKSFEMVQQKPRHWKLFMTLTMQPEVMKIVEQIAVEISSNIVSVLYNFFQNKNCKDPETEMFFLSSLLKGAIIQYIYMPKKVPLSKIKDYIIDFYKQKFK